MKKVMKAVAALMLMTAVFYPAECLNAQNHKGHDYVDLGLPSGTLWATCNVGATTPEGYGDYFAWGETQPKTTYNWSTYKYANGSKDKITKYCYTDTLRVLQSSDDAAMINWSSDWYMPTAQQWQELYQNTTNTWTTRKGVEGMLFTASNGNSLFLPATGCYVDSEIRGASSQGHYWSSSLNKGYEAWYFIIDSDSTRLFNKGFKMYANGYRSRGFSVRPVRSAK